MDRLQRKQYSADQLEAALMAINNGASIYETSKKFGIPRTTLRDKRDNKYSNENCGVQTVFTKDEERQLIDWIHYLGRLGFPVTKDQLLETVSKLVETLKRPNPFKDGVPGRHWFQNFLKRHPTISKRIAQNLPTNRNEVKEEAIRLWFGRVRQYFEQNNLIEVLDDPARIFNCDETGFFLCPKAKQVIVQRGSKKVYTRVANDEKECLTVLVNVAANGKVAPPMVLYPYKRMPKNLVPTVPSGWAVGNTESGWMNMGAFYEYITNCFYPWLVTNTIPLPVVLFLDGHTSHISLPLSSFCKEKGIILVALLPNSTHVLQPLDVAVFRPVKGAWKTVVSDFRINNNFAKLKRTDFAPQVKVCLDSCLTEQTIANGFRSCGLYPFEPNNVNYSKLLPEIRNMTSDTNSDTAEGSDSNTASSIHSQRQRTNQMKTFKQLFEDRLSPNVLEKFLSSGNVWTGDISYKKLFEYWKNIKRNDDDEERNLEIGDTTLVNNFADGTDLDTLTFEVTPARILPSEQNVCQEISYLTVNGTLTFPADHVLPENTQGLETSQITDSIKELLFSELRNDQDFISNTSDQDLRTSSPKPSTLTAKPSTSTPKSSTPTPKPSTSTCHSTCDNLISESLDSTIINRSEYCKTPLKSISKNIPKELNISTPFKNALYFPENKATTKKKTCKRVTPTVAISDEFMAYQKKIEADKLEKEEMKRKRNEDLEKKKKDKLIKQSNPKSKRLNKVKRKIIKVDASKENTTDSENDFQVRHKVRTYQASPYRDTATSQDVNICNYVSSSDDCEIKRPAKIITRPRYLGFDSESDESIF